MSRAEILVEEQRQQEIEDAHLEQEIMFLRGKIIVISVAVFVAIVGVINVFFSINVWNAFGAVLSIFAAIALVKGVAWVRYLLVGLFILSAFITFLVLGALAPGRSLPQGDSAGAFGGSTTVIFRETDEVRTIAHSSTDWARVVQPVSPTYVINSILFPIYIIFAGLLTFSKSVKKYMYEVGNRKDFA